MSAAPKHRSITLRPSWKQFAVGYVLSVLTIPLLVGLVGLYFVWRKHKRIRYQVTDRHITAIDSKYHRNIDLISIRSVEVTANWLQRKLGVGTLVIHTAEASTELKGMEHPDRLREMIEKAVEAQRQVLQEQSRDPQPEPKYKPGSMDRMDYLTGLWQQGLLSDEDYEAERKHFE